MLVVGAKLLSSGARGELAKLAGGEAKQGKRRVSRRKDLKQEFKRNGKGEGRRKSKIFLKCFLKVFDPLGIRP